MKKRVRLSDEEAKLLDLKNKKKTNYGNAQYCISDEQYEKLDIACIVPPKGVMY